MSLKSFFAEIFTWWGSQTVGTRFYTWRVGRLVGEDEAGNRYYRAQGHVMDPSVGAERRWVIYNGDADYSKVPPGWRGWLSHTYATPPCEETYQARPWEKPAMPNLTGTPAAYRPRGSLLSSGERPAATGDYVPWTPGE